MNKLKTIKNYMSPSSQQSDTDNRTTDSTTSSSDTVPESDSTPTTPAISRTAKLTKSINESTKRFSNLLQFNRNGNSYKGEDESSVNAYDVAAGELKRTGRAKFLRSNTLSSLRSKKRLDPNDPNAAAQPSTAHLTKKQVLQNDDLDPESVFATLNTDLDRLMQYFEETGGASATQQLEYSYFMETTDVTPAVYLSLLRHTKEVVRSTLVIYNQVCFLLK
jgi:hypothetical protein